MWRMVACLLALTVPSHGWNTRVQHCYHGKAAPGETPPGSQMCLLEEASLPYPFVQRCFARPLVYEGPAMHEYGCEDNEAAGNKSGTVMQSLVCKKNGDCLCASNFCNFWFNSTEVSDMFKLRNGAGGVGGGGAVAAALLIALLI